MSYKSWGSNKRQTVKANLIGKTNRVRGVAIRKGDIVLTVKRSEVLSLLTALITLGLK